jgi:hypothetical protein
MTRKATQYRPESGKRWATLISDGRVPPSTELYFNRDEPPRNRPIGALNLLHHHFLR